MWMSWNTVAVAAVAVEGLKVFTLSDSAWMVGNSALNISVPGKLPSVVRSPASSLNSSLTTQLKGPPRPLRCRHNTRSLLRSQ
jgi:hypothetical protein